tara:strand:+ start:1421 stop:3142 length:1722 start_codon:yes stop_codon:yes gene_type:complete
MAQPAIRYRNPGNLKPGSMAKGQNYWSQHGFSGISPGGFAQFDTNQGGIDALRQQLRIDRSRNPTLGAFLDKYVGIQADPTGTANAKINVPKTLGVGLDTPLQQIDEDALLRAMVISEGGQDSLQTYEPFMQPEPAPTPAAPSRGLRTPLSPDFMKTLTKANIPVPARQESTRTPDTGNLYQTKPLETEYGTMDWRSQTEPITPTQAEQLIGQEEAKKIREEEAFGPSGTAQPENEMISRYENAAGPATNPYSLDRAAKTAAPEQPSFLSRLGSGIKDNPETAAAIAALVGGVGSGLMGRGRLAKQQAEQDAANRQAAAYSNAISTLTRGRTTPVMAPEQVRSTPGTAETIFDVLGTLGSGAGQIAGDKRRRDQAAEDREFSRDIQTRELDIKEYEIEQRTLAAAAKAAARNITDKATGGITPKQAQVIRAGLDNLQAIFDSGGPFETGTLSFDRTYGESAAIQNDFESSRNTLIAEIKDLMGLDRLTDRDLQLVIETLPQRNDSAGAIRGTLRGIKNTLSRLESIYSGGGGGMGQATGNQFSNMTANQLADYVDQNPNDAQAEAEMDRRLGL